MELAHAQARPRPAVQFSERPPASARISFRNPPAPPGEYMQNVSPRAWIAIFRPVRNLRTNCFGVAIGENHIAAPLVAYGNFITSRNPSSIIEDGGCPANIRTFTAFMSRLLLDDH